MASDIGEIERRLWSVADQLRANSGFETLRIFPPGASIFGIEKVTETQRLARMNLAAHRLGGCRDDLAVQLHRCLGSLPSG